MKSFISYLIESSTLTESYKDAQTIFSRENDRETVAATLKKFKELVSANRVKPESKDITQWMKKPFKDLYNFVNQLESTPSGKETKKQIKGNSITLTSFGNWIAIIPLTKGASCFYGKGTEWCTAATKSDNYFDSYFDGGATLIYFINKKDGTKYAVAIQKNSKDGLRAEYFDERDNSITRAELAEDLGIDQNKLLDIMYQAGEHESVTSAHVDRRYMAIRKEVDNILEEPMGEDREAYHTYERIRSLLYKPNILAAVGEEKVQKLETKKLAYYNQYVNYMVDEVMKKLEYIKPLLKAGKAGSIYSRGSLREFQRAVDRLPQLAQKIAADKMQQIFAAYKQSNEIMETNREPSSQEQQDDELLAKLNA